MIEELVDKLAELQAEMRTAADKIAADPLIAEYTAAIAELEKQASEGRDALHDLVSAYGQDDLTKLIDEVEAEIIDEWTGEKKTMVFDAGTLKFRTTQSLEIENKTLVLTGLLDHTSVKDVANNYITGFNKTAVKKYMGVLELPMGAAEIEYKTTVKLEQ
jgi:NAD-dependent DNA ligase